MRVGGGEESRQRERQVRRPRATRGNATCCADKPPNFAVSVHFLPMLSSNVALPVDGPHPAFGSGDSRAVCLVAFPFSRASTTSPVSGPTEAPTVLKARTPGRKWRALLPVMSGWREPVTRPRLNARGRIGRLPPGAEAALWASILGGRPATSACAWRQRLEVQRAPSRPNSSERRRGWWADDVRATVTVGLRIFLFLNWKLLEGFEQGGAIEWLCGKGHCGCSVENSLLVDKQGHGYR